ESLFKYAVKGQWREALEAYNKNLGALEAKITRVEDTVLHVAVYILAGKPNCFKSSMRMELLQRIIYNCSIVDEIEKTDDLRCNEADTAHHYPMNYETRATFLSLLKSIYHGKYLAPVYIMAKGRTSKEIGKETLPFPPNWGATIRSIPNPYDEDIANHLRCWSILDGKIQRKKVKDILAKQVMNELIQRTSSSLYNHALYNHDHTGTGSINSSNNDQSKEKGGFQKIRRTDSPILIATKMGVTEMVEKILEIDPVAILDVDADNKNVVLSAIENRQPHVYSLLNKRSMIKETAFRQVDNQLVKNSMPPNFYERYNKNGQTAKQVFNSTHEKLAKEGGKWLTKTSESCSLVAALVATVAFTTSTAIPGGPDQNTGYPLFQGRPAFNIFAVASTVYKGRKKKTIEYFAIKSVDKSQKTKVLEEVRILHTLDHANVLKFYDWYETSAHLWLVLEYCVGGDLLSILRQDSQLPEDSVHGFAYNLVKALQFLHSNEIIYCDLKPSNILLDENGCAKLCDFGLARKLKDISKAPSSSLPRAKRGTPSYMAPELFEDSGVHSYASDFWALGCVLYECYAGRPPFVGREFTQLVKSIISDPTPPLPGNPSRPFVNLINSLLVKDPAERIQWPELCGHAFWRTKFTLLPLPAQPAFDDMIELHAKPCLSERNGDKSSHNRTPTKYREKDVKGALRKDENSVLGSRGIETPARATPIGHRTQTKGSGRIHEVKQKDNSNISKGVNLLRLSRIAKTNLQRENEKENYRRPLPNNSENDSEVKIENTDMELDFNENTEDDAHEETDGTEQTTPVPDEKTDNHFLNQGKAEEIENNTHQLDTPSVVHPPVSDDPRSFDHESTPDLPDISAISPSVSPQVKKHRTKEDAGSGLDFDSSRLSNNLSQVLWHPSDLSVRPVMPSRKIDKASEVIPSLPFEALQASDFVKMPKEKLEAIHNRILSILNGNTSIGEKQNVIRYLEMLSSNADAANILTNGPIMLMLVKLQRQSKASALRVQLASLIGLLIRHSTFVDDSLASSGILGALTDGLRDRQEKVRRFSMAALGELLFYISTQNADCRDNNQLESPSKDNRTTHGWQVPNSLISLVSSMLRKGEDDITQLYALRTIENICSQGGSWVGRLSSQYVISNLCYIYRASGKQESMRLTAGSCLVRLVRFNPPSIQLVIEKLSFKDLASALVKGSPREQQISLNLLNMAMLGSHMFTNIGRCLVSLAEDKNLIPSLLGLVEQGSEVLRGKALVLVALLCKHGRRWLPHFFCSQKLLSVVDRLGKEKDAYVRQCLDAFVHIVASSIPGLLDIITGDVQQMMGGRRQGHISALTSRSAPKTSIHLFPVVLHLLGTSTFKHKVVTPQVLRQLANLIKLVETPFQGRDDFQITLLRIFESLTEESPVILGNPDIFIREILPSSTVLYKGNKDGDARFLCLKILFDVMIILLSEPIEEEHRLKDLKFVSNTHFLPLYPTLIEDEDPIPIYAQKLLVMLMEFSFITIPDILHLKTISQCFEFLLGDLSNANVNNVKLCLALASAPEMESKLLSQLKVVRRIGNFLEFVYAKGMEDLLDPTLGLCKAFLARSVSCTKGFSYTTEPILLGDCPPELSGGAVDPQQCIKDIADFGSNVGVLLELSASAETSIADIASECVVLLLKAAPREATTGILTNLPKVTVILESWNRGIPHLMVQRMLHALGYACKQYLLHAMILSISKPEISRTEVIVSELKSSGGSALAKTAGLAALELQRLPRCI
ncbi:Serine/threonine-protein kinase ULK4, partial [Glycine soja]